MKHFLKILTLFICVVSLLASCGEENTVAPNLRPTVTALPNSATPTLVATTTTAPTGTAVVAASPTGATTPTTANEREKLLQALKSLAQSTSANYKISQTGELNNAGSLTRFDATGAGQWQAGTFRQSLATKLGGQNITLEYFGRGGELYERVSDLVLWRKVAQPVASPFPVSEKFAAGVFQAEGAETLAGQPTQRYTVAISGTLLLQAGQLERLGILNNSGLFQPFLNDSGAAGQATFWLAGNSQIVAYRATSSFKSNESSLRYTVTYEYRDFNSSEIAVKIPDDLPKK